MRQTMRIALALGFVGAVAVAGVAFGEAGSARDAERGDVGPFPGVMHGAPHRGGLMLFGTVYGERKVETDHGFALHRVDTGEITAIDGSTVTITRADDEVVEVTGGDDTRISRDRGEAELADLQAGDHAVLIRVDGALRAIHALSPDAYEEAKTMLEERRSMFDTRRGRFRERFRRSFRAHGGPSEEAA